MLKLISSVRSFLSLVLLSAILSCISVSAGATTPVRVVTFNVLAPLWADPALYPDSSWPLLDREFRRERIINTLDNLQESTDIFALQEIQISEYPYFAQALGPAWQGLAAYHSPDYWSQWLTSSLPWEQNGVAIFVKKRTFSKFQLSDIALSDSGNHAAFLNGTLKETGKSVRAASIHLDSDYPYNRDKEMRALTSILGPKGTSIDIIAGDINFDIDNGGLQDELKKAGYVDILKYLGTQDRTSPYAATYYMSDNWANIDHILVRNMTPQDGYVINFGLYQTYPVSNNDDDRIKANFEICGSDHFPVFGSATP